MATKALGWDDRDNSTMDFLKSIFKRNNIQFDWHKDSGQFLAEYEKMAHELSFVVLDLVHKDYTPRFDKEVGFELARNIAKISGNHKPIFILTSQIDAIDPLKNPDVPSNLTAILSKSTDTDWLALDIIERAGFHVREEQIFVIGSPDALFEDLQKQLETEGRTPYNAKDIPILDNLTGQQMNTSSGIICLLQYDANGVLNQETTLLLGIALAQPRGKERLLFISEEENPTLPAALADVKTIVWRQPNAKDELKEALKSFRL